MFDPEGTTAADGSPSYGNPGGPVAGSPKGEYTPSSEDLVRQWHDLNEYYLESKAAHERGEVGSTVPAGLQKQLMSVQEQIRKAQDVEGKLYTREDIGSVLASFAKTCYQILSEELDDVTAAGIAGRIEAATEGE